ncbi:ABC transporter substrate-binding protein [Salinibacterium sp. SYSU T00001]|uniref:ABC transporter substrate-binding protein n=1 Tax=Homoserinimonas sedimenticola TaxID=2986805 RepID=UPI002235C86E|nr:ABC transporter substrate-binding protein [Salinibacterium sedimenticola]MCW4386072.1 ABC transporter substrate-binding protein [Salinibacterium sedimenticola]
MRRTRTVAAAAAVLTVLLTGCSAAASAEGQTASVTVGVMPGADLAPLYVGIKDGIFAEHGIDVTVHSLAATTADIVRAVDEGRYDIGYADIISILAAQENGSELQIVSGAADTSGDARADYAGIVTAASDIDDVSDLTGRKVAVDTLGTTNEVVVRAAVDAAGGNSSTMTLEAIPFINARKAIEGGMVTAALMVEPYLTAARLDGLRIISHPYAEFDEKLTVSGYFTSTATASERSDVVESFVAALAESFEAAESNDNAVRTNISTFLSSDARVRTRLILPAFSTEIDRDAAQALADSALEYGLIARAPDLGALLP